MRDAQRRAAPEPSDPCRARAHVPVHARARTPWVRAALAAVLVASHVQPLVAQGPAPSEESPGAVTTVEAATRDLSTPRRSLAAFLESARDREWEAASASLDLREVPVPQRAAVAEQVSRDLEIVLSDQGVVPDAVPDEEEPGGDRAVELVRFEGIDQGVVLRRVSAGGKTSWRFSAGTVRTAGELRGSLDRGPLGDLVPESLREPRFLSLELWQWLAIPIAMLLALLGAWILGRATTRVAARLARRVDRAPFTSLLARVRLPVRGAYFLAVLGMLAIPIHFPQRFLAIPGRLYVVAWAIVVGWCFWRMVDFVAEKIEERAAVQDDWRARQVRTRAGAVRRVLHLTGVVLAVGTVLLQIDPIRELGVSLLASAGVAGIVLGIAAQRTIGNLIAGIQLSFTQPLRVGDQVVVAEQFGTVEEITLSYVVMRLPDHRRFVVPISTLLETPFENWTRLGSDLVGSVVFPVDFTTPVERVRTDLARYVRAHPLFDGETFELAVAEVRDHTVELRVLVSAADATALVDLRCAVREFLMRLLQTLDDGRYLPRLRVDDLPRARRAVRDAVSPS